MYVYYNYLSDCELRESLTCIYVCLRIQSSQENRLKEHKMSESSPHHLLKSANLIYFNSARNLFFHTTPSPQDLGALGNL